MPRDASLLMPAEAAAAMAAELGHPMLVIELLRKDRLQVTAAELLGLEPFGDDPGPGSDDDNPLSPSGFLYSMDVPPMLSRHHMPLHKYFDVPGDPYTRYREVSRLMDSTDRPDGFYSPVNVWRIRVDFDQDSGDARWTLLRVK